MSGERRAVKCIKDLACASQPATIASLKYGRRMMSRSDEAASSKMHRQDGHKGRNAWQMTWEDYDNMLSSCSILVTSAVRKSPAADGRRHAKESPELFSHGDASSCMLTAHVAGLKSVRERGVPTCLTSGEHSLSYTVYHASLINHTASAFCKTF